MVEKLYAPSVQTRTAKDIIQIIVGSFTGALVFITSSDIITISDNIPLSNLCLIVATSVFFSYATSYLIDTYSFGERRMSLLTGLLPRWTLIQYFTAVFFSLTLCYMLGINTLSTPLMMVVKRTFVLAMPSTITASAADLIESQKAPPRQMGMNMHGYTEEIREEIPG
jgi:uncharacterized membrane protein